MVYLVSAAMGFAAFENILLLLRMGPVYPVSVIVETTVFRFIGATFLHVLASAILGYFIARAMWSISEHPLWARLKGFFFATLLHGLFNFYIYTGGEKLHIIKGDSETLSERTLLYLYLLIPTIILIGLAFFVSVAFQRLKQAKKRRTP